MLKEPSVTNQLPIPLELIERRIYILRGQKVMLDFDLAELYQVPTYRLNEAVKRNNKRFPEDFMFQLTKEELKNWISQIAISNPGTKMGLRRPPYVFTELGVAMLSSVLNSELAIRMNIVIMRAFVKLRHLVATHKELADKMDSLEHRQKEQGIVLALVIGDIKTLEKKVMKEFKKLKTFNKRRVKIGFRAE